MDITAAVVPEKFKAFEIRKVELTDPRADEVLVRIVASGMCQTDLHARDGYYPTLKYPAVFGHEGAGVVAAVGSAVRKVAPGDHVIISFPWCGACPNCRQQAPAYCLDARKLKSSGTRADGSTLMCVGDDPVYSAFFQQSSFGTHAISNERFVVKVRKDAPLDRLGPFACSIQTGAGAVLNAMRPKPGDILRGVRRRRGRPVRADGREIRRLRPADRGRRARAASHARARARRDACHQSQRRHRRGGRDQAHHRHRRALRAGDLRAARRVPRGGRGADAGRHVRAGRHRARRHRGDVPDAGDAERPHRARRDPGRQPAGRIHPASWST